MYVEVAVASFNYLSVFQERRNKVIENLSGFTGSEKKI